MFYPGFKAKFKLKREEEKGGREPHESTQPGGPKGKNPAGKRERPLRKGCHPFAGPQRLGAIAVKAEPAGKSASQRVRRTRVESLSSQRGYSRPAS